MISLCDRGCQARERDHGGALPRVHVPQEIMRTCVRWYVAYPLRTPHVEALMRERGVPIDHATVNRWVVTYRPPREEALPRRKQPVWLSWRMEETSLQGTGEWRDRDRAVEKMVQTIDFLRTEPRDEQAATCFLTKAIRRHGVPETITIDGSAANEAAITRDNEEHGTAIDIRPMKYLPNMVEQDHRGVTRVTRPRLGFKSCAAAQDTLVGIELRHMLKKRPLVVEEGDEALTPAEQFYALAASSLHQQGQLFLQYLPEQNLRHNRKCHFGA